MNKMSVILKWGGALLIAAAIGLTMFNMIDDGRAGAKADDARQALTAQIASVQRLNEPQDDTDVFPEQEPPTCSVEDIAYIGVLELPSLGLSLPVCDGWSYDLLQLAPCRYSGTPYGDSFVICAHNYSSHFGRLGEINPGDEATFTDMSGRRFFYKMIEQEIVAPDEAEKMTDSGYALTLFSCNWNGTARVTLRFDAVDAKKF